MTRVPTPPDTPLASVSLELSGIPLTIHGYPDDYIFEFIKNRKTLYEYDVLDFLGHALVPEEGSLILDIGANLGNHTLYFGVVLKSRVLAIEPERHNLFALNTNIIANEISDLVEVVPAAAWDSNTQVFLTQNIPGNRGTFSAQRGGTFATPTIVVDDVVGDRNVSLIKVDAEGAEERALSGCIRTIARDLPIIVVETHSAEHMANHRRMLEPHGYSPVAILGLSRNVVWVAPQSRATDLTTLQFMLFNRTHSRKVAHSFDLQGRRLQELTAMTGRIEQSVNSMLTHATADAENGQISIDTLHEHLDHSLADLDDRMQQTFARELRTALLASETELRKHRRTLDQRDRLVRAYSRLSARYERAHPDEWSTGPALKGVLGDAATQEFVSIVEEALEAEQDWGSGDTASPKDRIRGLRAKHLHRDPVRIGIASMPGREAELARVLQILSPQADEIFVYLNGMDAVPKQVRSANNIHFYTGKDLGDRGKFVFLEGFDGYFLTCDDDIAYAPYHVASIIDGIERYGRKAVVGWHGSIFSDDFKRFYDAKYRRVLSFRTLRGNDTGVHLLGTGVCGFHTETIRPELSEFQNPNMADVYLAIHAQLRNIPMVVLAHQGGEATALDTPGSISGASLGKDERGKGTLNVAEVVSNLVTQHAPWKINAAQPVFIRTKRRVAIVGRTDITRWKKGGILKSCLLTRQMLLAHGWDARLFDIQTGDPIGQEGFSPDLVMVYVGDPDRPDFRRVVEIVEHHALKGVPVLVNLSDNGKPARLDAIREQLRLWKARFRGLVRMMVFTSEVKNRPQFADIQDMIVTLPKTMTYIESGVAAFPRTKGVFVGDIAKLSDAGLVGGDARDWIGAIRRALPGVPVYGVRQYAPKVPLDLGLDEVWPFLKGTDFVDRLKTVRVMVSAVKYATFEMVPIEVSALGIPVFHRRMPQSLSPHFGCGGIEVDQPSELESRLPHVYHDPLVWRNFSEAGRKRAESAELVGASASMFLELENLIASREQGKL